MQGDAELFLRVSVSAGAPPSGGVQLDGGGAARPWPAPCSLALNWGASVSSHGKWHNSFLGGPSQDGVLGEQKWKLPASAPHNITSCQDMAQSFPIQREGCRWGVGVGPGVCGHVSPLSHPAGVTK